MAFHKYLRWTLLFTVPVAMAAIVLTFTALPAFADQFSAGRLAISVLLAASIPSSVGVLLGTYAQARGELKLWLYSDFVLAGTFGAGLLVIGDTGSSALGPGLCYAIAQVARTAYLARLLREPQAGRAWKPRARLTARTQVLGDRVGAIWYAGLAIFAGLLPLSTHGSARSPLQFVVIFSSLTFCMLAIGFESLRFRRDQLLTPINWLLLGWGINLVLLPQLLALFGPTRGTLLSMPNDSSISQVIAWQTLAFGAFAGGLAIYGILGKESADVPPPTVPSARSAWWAFTLLSAIGFLGLILRFRGMSPLVAYLSGRGNLPGELPNGPSGFLGLTLTGLLALAACVLAFMEVPRILWVLRWILVLVLLLLGTGVFNYNRSLVVVAVLALASVYSTWNRGCLRRFCSPARWCCCLGHSRSEHFGRSISVLRLAKYRYDLQVSPTMTRTCGARWRVRCVARNMVPLPLARLTPG